MGSSPLSSRRARSIWAGLLVFLGCLIIATSVLAGEGEIYPKENLAQFVIERLDVTSFPSSLGPRRVTGKTSFEDYGIVPRRVEGLEAVVEEQNGGWIFRIKVLRRTASGIFVCLEDRAGNGGTYHTQQVLWLTRSNSTSLLRGEESTASFKDCPPFRR
jgi:hypothetical protein